MAQKANEKSVEAEKLFLNGMALVDIANMLDVPASTVRRWKSTYCWDNDSERSEKKKKQYERSLTVRKEKYHKKQKKVKEAKSDIEQVEGNNELNEKQKLFCLYYSRSFNATRSYQKAYGCSYESALCNGPRLLANERVKEEVLKLKKDRCARELITEDDIFDKMIQIAYSDITDYVEFGREEVPVMTMYGPLEIKDEHGNKQKVTKVVNTIRFREHTDVDGTIITEVKQGKDGASIKLADKMKALMWLAEHKDLATAEQRARIAALNKQSGINANDNGENTGVVLLPPRGGVNDA